MNRFPKRTESNKIYFRVQSKLDIWVSTTRLYWNIITHIKHPTLKGKEVEVKKTLADPEEIRVSKKDKSVLLFYRKIEKLYLCVVVRSFKKRGFIITAYWTKKIKEGELR